MKPEIGKKFKWIGLENHPENIATILSIYMPTTDHGQIEYKYDNTNRVNIIHLCDFKKAIKHKHMLYPYENTSTKTEEDHTGQVFNEYTGKWTWF